MKWVESFTRGQCKRELPGKQWEFSGFPSKKVIRQSKYSMMDRDGLQSTITLGHGLRAGGGLDRWFWTRMVRHMGGRSLATGGLRRQLRALSCQRS